MKPFRYTDRRDMSVMDSTREAEIEALRQRVRELTAEIARLKKAKNR